MSENKLKYNYDDVVVVPDIATDIVSRKQCDWKTDEGISPIWVAPMDTVVSADNWKVFYDAYVNVVIPRNIPFDERIDMFIKFSQYKGFSPFVAFSFQETAKIFTTKNRVTSLLKKNKNGENDENSRTFRFCIDMANGHMLAQINLIKEIKENYGDQVKIMGGNIANPETYRLYDEAGCDYLRCGIGGGSACLVGGTKIKMADGSYENIEDVDVGDYVKTLNGNKRVKNTFEKNVTDTVVINGSIESTRDHEFLVIKKSDVFDGMTDEDIKKLAVYVPAEELTDNYMLVSDTIL